jgi:hypothetical protein
MILFGSWLATGRSKEVGLKPDLQEG